MRVLLAGATGALGIPLTKRLLAAGHEVVGITRSVVGAESIRRLGAQPILADVLDRGALLDAIRGLDADAVLHQLTALKRPPARHRDMRQTDILRTTGTAHLLDAARAVGASRFVTQSIVFGYGFTDHGTRPLTETDPFGVSHGNAFDPHVEAIASAERQIFDAAGIDGVALRYGLFYGADLANVERMLRRRALPVVRDGGELAFLHHADAATATVAALERGRPNEAYNVVDDKPATFRELVSSIAKHRSAPPPVVLPQRVFNLLAPYGGRVLGTVSLRVSNEKAASELGWRPQFASISDGLARGESAL